MTNYKDNRIIDGKPRWVIVDDDEKIIKRYAKIEELKGLDKAIYNHKPRPFAYTDDQLLNYLKQFYYNNGRAPKRYEFDVDPAYPGKNIYHRRFGGWTKALEIAGLLDKRVHGNTKYTSEEMLSSLIQFYEEYGRPPTCKDFRNNPLYVNAVSIIMEFGSWNKALKIVGLDPDSLIKKGVRVQNSLYKGRLFELYIKEHFNEISEDLSGNNRKSPFDGICPNGMIYEAKSSSFDRGSWNFHFYNSEKEKILWYYLGAFNEYYTKLLYVWRVPAGFIEGDRLYIGLTSKSKFYIGNMKEFEITDKVIEILKEKKIIL